MSWNFFAIEIHIFVLVYFEGFLSNENNFPRNKFLSYFLSVVVLRAVSISSSRWSWGWAISFSSNSFRCFPFSQPEPGRLPLLAGRRRGWTTPACIECRIKDFLFASHEETRKEQKIEMKIPNSEMRWRMWIVFPYIRWHFIKSFYCSTKVQLRNRYVCSRLSSRMG